MKRSNNQRQQVEAQASVDKVWARGTVAIMLQRVERSRIALSHDEQQQCLLARCVDLLRRNCEQQSYRSRPTWTMTKAVFGLDKSFDRALVHLHVLWLRFSLSWLVLLRPAFVVEQLR